MNNSPKYWIKAEHHNNGLIAYNYSWISDVLMVKDTGEYSIVVTGSAKIKTYKGKLSRQRLKKLQMIADDIENWDTAISGMTEAVTVMVCDGDSWELIINSTGKVPVDIHWATI